MKRRTIFIISGIAALAAGFIGYRILGSNGSPYQLATVQKGDLVQEVSASGKVEPAAKINLHFKNSGKLTILNVKVGQKVMTGQLLAKQDTGVLDAQLAEMRAGIDVQKAKLEQLKAGASQEDIKAAETAVNNAKQDFVDVLQDAYTKTDNAISGTTDQFFITPQSDSPHLNFSILDLSLKSELETRRAQIAVIFKSWRPYLDKLTVGDDLFAYSSTTKNYLNTVKIFLDKLSLAINNPTSTQLNSGQPISSTWITNTSTARANINTAIANLTTAESDLKTAQDQLDLKTAPPRSSDVALYEAQIRQAEAQMQKIQAQRQEMMIVAPSTGIITETNGEVGEILIPDTTAVSLMPRGSLQIKVNISEADIVDAKVGQEARITLDAFGNDREWKGKVVSIDPAETIIGGAVYYKTTVLFDKEDEGVRSGMTANIWVKTAQKENILFVPLGAIKEKRGKESADSRLYPYVEVLEDGRVKEKDVQTGMKGEGGMIEIVSGINEGEQVILSNK